MISFGQTKWTWSGTAVTAATWTISWVFNRRRATRASAWATPCRASATFLTCPSRTVPNQRPLVGTNSKQREQTPLPRRTSTPKRRNFQINLFRIPRKVCAAEQSRITRDARDCHSHKKTKQLMFHQRAIVSRTEHLAMFCHQHQVVKKPKTICFVFYSVSVKIKTTDCSPLPLPLWKISWRDFYFNFFPLTKGVRWWIFLEFFFSFINRVFETRLPVNKWAPRVGPCWNSAMKILNFKRKICSSLVSLASARNFFHDTASCSIKSPPIKKGDIQKWISRQFIFIPRLIEIKKAKQNNVIHTRSNQFVFFFFFDKWFFV